jgi:hypothetical protein
MTLPDGIRIAMEINPEFITCSEANQLCQLSMAMPTPIVTPTPTMTPTPQFEQANIRQLLSYPGCVSPCWLGIAPGDDESTAVERLDAVGISYIRNSLGLEGNIFSYSLLSGYSNPLISLDTTIIFITEQEVAAIVMVLYDVEVNDVVAHFGLPTKIIDLRNSNFALAYESQGLLFYIEDSDKNNIESLTMTLPDGIRIAMEINPEFITCSEANQLCQLSMAMPTPVFTPTTQP